jgi:hypothetical protein
VKAISLSRPWPYSFFHLGKGLENRSRKDGRMPHICSHRGPLLLHAAKSWDKGAAEWVERAFPDPLGNLNALKMSLGGPKGQRHPAGCIVGRCTAVAHVDDAGEVWAHARGEVQTGEHLALAARLAKTLDMRWWMGGYALVLEDIEEFATPIPCRGHLGLWTPPPDVLEEALAA